MAEKCDGGVVFTVTASVPEIGAVSPVAKVVDSRAELFDTRSKVTILDEGSHRVIRIKGACPNFRDGVCVSSENCVWENLQGSNQ